jgi:hypothetical protein
MTHLSSKLHGMMISEYPADPENFFYKWTAAGGITTATYKRFICTGCRSVRDQNRRTGLQTGTLNSRKASAGDNPEWLVEDTTQHICDPIPLAKLIGMFF